MAYSGKAKVVVLIAVLLGVIAIVDFGQNYADNNRITAMVVNGESGCVRSDPTIIINPYSREGFVGQIETYKVTIFNKDSAECGPILFDRWITSIGSYIYATDSFAGKALPPISPQASFTYDMYVSVSDKTQLGEYGLGVLIKNTTNAKSYSANAQARLVVSSEPLTEFINVSNGWNMIGAGSLYGLQSTSCNKNNIYKTVYNWNPAKNEYDTCQLTDSLSTGQCFEVIRAVWLYNFGDSCFLKSLPGPGWSADLSRGWNMLAVLPSWKGKSVSDVIGDCKFGGGWEYKSDAEGWNYVSPDRIFRQDQVGKGIWAYCA